MHTHALPLGIAAKHDDGTAWLGVEKYCLTACCLPVHRHGTFLVPYFIILNFPKNLVSSDEHSGYRILMDFLEICFYVAMIISEGSSFNK